METSPPRTKFQDVRLQAHQNPEHLLHLRGAASLVRRHLFEYVVPARAGGQGLSVVQLMPAVVMRAWDHPVRPCSDWGNSRGRMCPTGPRAIAG
jgi:hypothetical protein